MNTDFMNRIKKYCTEIKLNMGLVYSITDKNNLLYYITDRNKFPELKENYTKLSEILNENNISLLVLDEKHKKVLIKIFIDEKTERILSLGIDLETIRKIIPEDFTRLQDVLYPRIMPIYQ